MPKRDDTILLRTYLKQTDGERIAKRAAEKKMTVAAYLRSLIAQDLASEGKSALEPMREPAPRKVG